MKFESRYFYFLIPALLSFFSCSDKNQYRYEEGMVWNTLYHIKYQSAEPLGDSILAVLNEIDLSLSPFNENSVISKINVNVSDSADPHFVKVYNESRRINRATGGEFDPTLAPLIRAWGFGQGHSVSADTLRIDSLLQLVGITKTRLQGSKIIKDNPQIEFNFSALAKGYGVDCMAEMMERNGVENYLIEIGGEIRSAGVNQSGDKWSVGINRPEVGAGLAEIVMNVYLNDAAVATSGNYRNYQEEGSKRFGHTISSATGRPIETDVISATVISPRCMEADAIATSCMVLGSSKALTLCDSLKLGCLLILKDMSTKENDRFRNYLSE